MKLGDILRAAPGARLAGPADAEVSGLAFDSRAVKPGDLFFAVPGTKADGSAFIGAAIAAGAKAVVTSRPEAVPSGTASVGVEDVRRAMARMSRVYYGEPDRELKVVGITGTKGKTTTAFLAKHLLEAAGWRCGLLGTVRYEIGPEILPAPHTTPEAPEVFGLLRRMADAGCGAAAMEVSSHALHQERTGGLDFDVGVFTNLTRDHLDYHLTMEAYFEAKRGLFTGLGTGAKPGAAVANADDPWGRRLLADPAVRVKKTAFAPAGAGLETAGAPAVAWRLAGWTGRGARAVFGFQGREAEVEFPAFGAHNLANAAAALGAVAALGAEFPMLVAALAGAPAVPGRLQPVPNARGISVLVDYAHTDDALRKALAALRELPHRRILTVFGCGGDRDRGKRPLMGVAAAEGSDRVFLTSDNPRSENPGRILDDIVAGLSDAGMRAKCEVVADRREAIGRAIREAGAGDIVLIAGKGHENYQEIQGVKHPFDDVVVAAEHLEGRA